MSRALVGSLAVAAALLGAARGDGSDRWLAALYLAGDSDLWQTAQYAASKLLQAAPSADVVMLLDGPPGQASRGRVSLWNGSRWQHEDWGPLNTGGAATLRRFSQQALAASRADRRMLLLLGHGRPPTDLADPWRTVVRAGGLGLDWSAGGDSLTPAEVEAALKAQSWDVVVLACCYGMSMEMGWSLRGTKALLAGAPGVAVLRARDLVDFVRRLDTRPAPVMVARGAAEMLTGGKGAAVAGWAEVRGIAALGELIREVGAAVREDARGAALALEAVRPAVCTWGPSGELADVGALAQALAGSLPTARGREVAGTAARTARAVVRGVGVSGKGAGCAQFGPVGLGIFLPPRTGPWDEYDSEVPFGRECGWTATLKTLEEIFPWSVGSG